MVVGRRLGGRDRVAVGRWFGGFMCIAAAVGRKEGNRKEPEDHMLSPQECSGLMPTGLSAQQQLDFATEYLYNRWGLKIAKV